MFAITYNRYFWWGLFQICGFVYFHFFYPTEIQERIGRGELTSDALKRPGLTFVKWGMLILGSIFVWRFAPWQNLSTD